MLELLEVLRVQRHDFLNHLQVISGLIQLKKYDRAGEYIRQIGDELSRAGVLARLGSKPIVAEVLIAQLNAHKKGIALDCVVHSGLEGGINNEDDLAEIIKQMFETAINLTEVSTYGHGNLNFEIKEKNGECHFLMSFRSREAAEDSRENIESITDGAVRAGGSFNVNVTADNLTLFTLTAPVSQ